MAAKFRWTPEPLIQFPDFTAKSADYPGVAALGSHAAVGSDRVFDAVCTGAVLSKRVVLTAKHCIEKWRDSISDVVVGDDYRDGFPIVPRGDLELIPDADLALVELKQDAPGGRVLGFEHVGEPPAPSAKYIVTGFGWTQVHDTETLLGGAEFTLVDRGCERMDRYRVGVLCIARKNGGLCPKDSGAPLIARSGNVSVFLGTAVDSWYDDPNHPLQLGEKPRSPDCNAPPGVTVYGIVEPVTPHLPLIRKFLANHPEGA